MDKKERKGRWKATRCCLSIPRLSEIFSQEQWNEIFIHAAMVLVLCEHYNLSLLLCYYKTDVWKQNLKVIGSWLEARTLRKKIVLLYSQAIIFLEGHKNGVPF